jgi:hypothetical protein
MSGAKHNRSILACLLLGLALCSQAASAGQHLGAHPNPSKPTSHLGPHDYVQYKFSRRAYNLSRSQTSARDSRGGILRNPRARREFRGAHPLAGHQSSVVSR